MADNKTYVPWINWAKIVGIYLVTLGHGHLVSDDVRVLIYSFHMPLFFVLSGVLYKRRGFVETVRKTFKTLLIPYFLISFICLGYYLALLGLQGGITWIDIWNRVGAIFLGLGYEANNWIPVSSPMWFVIALWVVYLLMSLSQSKHCDLAVLLIAVVASLVLHFTMIDTLLPIDSALVAMPFFVVGYKLKNFIINTDFKRVVIPALILLPVWYLVASYNGRVDMCGCNYGRSIILFYLAGMMMCFIVISLCKIFQTGGAKYASGTFLVMGFNIIAVNITELVWKYFVPATPINTIIGAALGLLILAVFYPIIVLCKKYFPIIIGNR